MHDDLPSAHRELLKRALDIPVDEREAFIRKEADTAEQASKLLTLLAQSTKAETTIDTVVRAEQTTDAADAKPKAGNYPDRVQSTATGDLLLKIQSAPKLDQQRFQLEDQVGQGGVGAVTRVQDRVLNRRLAMKTLLDREEPRDEEERRLESQRLGRFLEEAQVTSQLDHPGVVPVHELGLDQNGKVFFTMRLVKGRTLGEVFTDAIEGKNDWTLTRALEVMLKVCDTMAYAHEKRVLHRDLKPANVMVGRFGEVYVMDWGLAKILDQDDLHDIRIREESDPQVSILHSVREQDAKSDATSSVVTLDGTALGTPSYMPPEQAKGAEPDLRADVYAVGAMLYHLLSGQAPYTVPGMPKNAYRILEDVFLGPPRPIEQLKSGVPAALVAITEKAMARERDDRYATVVDLADDLRAFLENRVVRAHRTGAWVEMKKWVQRNRAFAASVAAGLVASLAFGAFAFVQYLRAEESLVVANKARQVAQANQEKAEKLAGEKTALATAESAARQEADEQRQIAEAKTTEAKENAATAAARAAELQQVSHFQANQLANISPKVMGATIKKLVIDRARAADQRAGRDIATLDANQAQLEQLLARANFTGVALDVLDSQIFAAALQELERYDQQPLLQATLLQVVSDELSGLGLLTKALGSQLKATEIRRRELGDNHSASVRSIGKLGGLYEKQGRYDLAEPLLREVLVTRRQTLGDQDPLTYAAMHNLGLVLHGRGKLAEAEPLLRASLEADRRRSSVMDQDMILSIIGLGSLLRDQGKLAEAEQLHREALTASQRLLGHDHPSTLNSMQDLAEVLRQLESFEKAEKIAQRALELCRSALGDKHPGTLVSINLLGRIYFEQGMLSAAEPLLTEAVVTGRRALGNAHPRTLYFIDNLGRLLYQQGRYDTAEQLFSEAARTAKRTLGDKHPMTQQFENSLSALRAARREATDKNGAPDNKKRDVR